MAKTVCHKGISYVVGVLIVLSVALSAVVIYASVVGFQAQTVTSFSVLESKRAGESLVIVEYNRPSNTLVVYNNGIVPTCFVELTLPGSPPFYSNPGCTPIQPKQYATITVALVNPPQKFTIIARTTNNKILTYTIS